MSDYPDIRYIQWLQRMYETNKDFTYDVFLMTCIRVDDTDSDESYRYIGGSYIHRDGDKWTCSYNGEEHSYESKELLEHRLYNLIKNEEGNL